MFHNIYNDNKIVLWYTYGKNNLLKGLRRDMGIIENMSSYLIARGFNYYKKSLVKKIEKLNETTYKAKVLGTSEYDVYIDLEHPRKCRCTCPYNKILCKHIAATYFSINEKEAILYEDSISDLLQMRNNYYDSKEKDYEQKYKTAKKYVESLTEEEVRKELLNRIISEDYDEYDRYDERMEEDFEMLDEIDDDVLDMIEKQSRPKLSSFINAFEFISDEESWINIKTTKVYTIYDFEKRYMSEEEIEEFTSEDYIMLLPNKYELREYDDMISFTNTINDEIIEKELNRALKGKGAFRRFKELIIYYNLKERWYKYKNHKLKDKVVKWLKENEIDYIDDTN